MTALDDGFYRLSRVSRIPVFFPALEPSVNAARYSVKSSGPVFSEPTLRSFMALETFPYERVKESGKRQLFDVRACLDSAATGDGGRSLELLLNVAPGASLKPETAASVIFGIPPEFESVRREELYWKNSAGALEVF